MLPNRPREPEPVVWWVVVAQDGTHHSTHLHEADAYEVREQVSRDLQRPFRVVKKTL